jgi:hypothetical protein
MPFWLIEAVGVINFSKRSGSSTSGPAPARSGRPNCPTYEAAYKNTVGVDLSDQKGPAEALAEKAG